MQDKNGIEIKTGMIVEITGAYFKRHNGLYFVENSPGDPSWCGSDHSLKRISKAGKISKAADSTCFWPIMVFVSDRAKAAEADRWNKEHAEIEVKEIKNMAVVAAYFEQRAEEAEERIHWTERNFGEEHPEVEQNRALKAHYEAVAAWAAGGEARA